MTKSTVVVPPQSGGMFIEADYSSLSLFELNYAPLPQIFRAYGTVFQSTGCAKIPIEHF